MQNKRIFCACIFIFFFVLDFFANPFYSTDFTDSQTSLEDSYKDTKPTIQAVRTSTPNQKLVTSQLDLRNRLGSYLSNLKQERSQRLLWSMMFVAFLYGVLHALGPGHRKTIVFSYYLARKAPAWEPALMSLFLSTLHGGAAFILLMIIKSVSLSLGKKASSVSIYMEGFSYLFLALTALTLMVFSLVELFSKEKKTKKDSLSKAAILISGIYPCPGAIFVLVLSISLDLSHYGLLAVIAMSLGMTLPIVGAAYLAWFGRTGFFLALKKNEKLVGSVSSLIELTGFCVLFVFSVWIALPFISSLWARIVV